MRTIQFYKEIAGNYMNGNISDFKKGLKRLTKKELLVFASMFGRCFIMGSQEKANNIIFKYLD